MISVLILTKNERSDLPGCLESVAWCDDIHVVDSGSTDNTCEIARAHGATVSVKAYPDSSKSFGGDEAAHRNWSLRTTPFKYPWVLLVDADERVTPGLAAAIRQQVAAPGNCVAFQVQRRDFFMGTWLKHAQNTPYYLRLFRPEKMRYERLINPVSIVDGPIGRVAGYLDHFPFSKGIAHWISKHNAYSSLEAGQISGERLAHAKFSLRKALKAPDLHERRYHQKEFFYRLPFRPLIKFTFLYFYKRGFLDGSAGTTYALLQAMYEYMIVVKVRELKLAS
ncbi:MAG: glycosyltransferase family 2 protein [Pseudomonadota bacterium]|nr:glycosyltransferase family 2 protein [Pseudomonadota bacterium]